MATFTIRKDGFDVWGGRVKVCTGDFAADDDYPTGGYPLPISKFGFKELWNVIAGQCGVAAVGAYTVVYDTVNKKLMFFEAGVEVASSGDLSAVTALRITALGR